MSGASGDFGRLQATINALSNLHSVPSQVAPIAAPKLTERMQQDARSGQDPYGRGYAPHELATVKRWGPHPVLRMSGDGVGSLRAVPAGGSGINVEVDQHMVFTQAGTPTQVVRAVLPNRPQLPASYTRILEDATEQVLTKRLEVIK